ncbi:ras family-domain-containing protein [Auriculariales sp. MPI-PUGE-AT-0066]|nr:ras family-domain-containing protein [Auriculariales sp. MPI-PUGE-AT-0066]
MEEKPLPIVTPSKTLSNAQLARTAGLVSNDVDDQDDDDTCSVASFDTMWSAPSNRSMISPDWTPRQSPRLSLSSSIDLLEADDLPRQVEGLSRKLDQRIHDRTAQVSPKPTTSWLWPFSNRSVTSEPLETNRSGISEPRERLRLVLVGDNYVGKSSLLYQYINGCFDAKPVATIGLHLAMKTLRYDGREVILEIWDTQGQLRFGDLKAVSRWAHGAIAVFDLTSAETLLDIDEWLEKIERPVHMVLIGNKCDEQPRQVQAESAKAFAAARGMAYYETSAKDSVSVERVFRDLVNAIRGGIYASGLAENVV